MSISRFFIDRPIFAAVVALVITIIGAIGYSGLGVNQLPEITPPTITVTASYPGASAQTVADTVAAPIEQEVNGVEGMIYMASQSTSRRQRVADRHLRRRHRHRQGAGAGAEPRQRRRAPPARRGAPQRPHRAQALARPAAGDPPDLARQHLRPGLHLQLRPAQRPRQADAPLRRRRRVRCSACASIPCASGSTPSASPCAG